MLEAESRALSTCKNYDRDFASPDQVKSFLQILRKITLILVGLLWNGTGALVLGIGGDIRWDWLPVLVVGSLVGGYAGAHLSLERGSELVKRGFELLAFTMGVSLLIRSL